MKTVHTIGTGSVTDAVSNRQREMDLHMISLYGGALMACDVTWEDGLVVFDFHDILTDEDLLEANAKVYQSSELSTMTGQLILYSEATQIDFSARAVRSVSHRDSELAVKYPGVKVAIVTNNQLLIGLTRLYEMSGISAGWQTELFQEEASARNWLSVSEKPTL